VRRGTGKSRETSSSIPFSKKGRGGLSTEGKTRGGREARDEGAMLLRKENDFNLNGGQHHPHLLRADRGTRVGWDGERANSGGKGFIFAKNSRLQRLPCPRSHHPTRRREKEGREKEERKGGN